MRIFAGVPREGRDSVVVKERNFHRLIIVTGYVFENFTHDIFSVIYKMTLDEPE